jgi:hypothetical protein
MKMNLYVPLGIFERKNTIAANVPGKKRPGTQTRRRWEKMLDNYAKNRRYMA